MVILSRRAFERIRRQYWQQYYTPRRMRSSGQEQADAADLLRFKNVSGQPLPLGTVLRVQNVPADASGAGDAECTTVGSTLWPIYVVCAEETVMPGEHGIASWATTPTVVRRAATLSPVAGQYAAPDSEGHLMAGLPGFWVLSVIDAYYCWAIQMPARRIFGLALSSISRNAVVSVAPLRWYAADSVWRKTSKILQARDIWLNQGEEDLPANTKVLVEAYLDEWLIVQAYCEAATPAIDPDGTT